MSFPTFLVVTLYERKERNHQGNFTLFLCTLQPSLWMLSLFSKRLSRLPSQAEIKAGVEQVGKLGMRVEPFRYHMPLFFMPPLTKDYGRKHAPPHPSLSLTHTQTSKLMTKTAAPSLTLFCMPSEIVFPLPSRTAV